MQGECSELSIKESRAGESSGNVAILFGASYNSERMKVVEQEVPGHLSGPNHQAADLNTFSIIDELPENPFTA